MEKINGIDLFCGVGGLTYGLQKAGINIVAGLDLDPACKFPFERNNAGVFLQADVTKVSGKYLNKLYPSKGLRLLAGCAPCQPFSPYRRGEDTSVDKKWGLLGEFARLVDETRPDLVTMENVPGLASRPIFLSFLKTLKDAKYFFDWRSIYCPTFGIPQHRRRLVLVASKLKKISVPATGPVKRADFQSVRDAIAHLPAIRSGECDPLDPLHRARALDPVNIKRIRASKPGGTWEDWPAELRAPCHRKKSGRSYKAVYARMSWDEPAPTITTQAYNYGTGRFGHPEQDRPISLREAAILQTFPLKYQFVGSKEDIDFSSIGRLIGNAVPPQLGYAIGKLLTNSRSVSKKKEKK